MNKDFIEVNPQKVSGLPVFAGTRVPISYLFEFLKKGETLTEFFRQFPSVSREQAVGVLKLSKESLLAKREMLLVSRIQGSLIDPIPRRMMRWRRATRRGLIWGLKTVRGLGIIAERNAASFTLSDDAGLRK
jgi:uncharacterized protein (DUF433 family)